MEAEQLPVRREDGESPSGSSLSGQLSCVQCRNRKLKCDRKHPICGRCVKQKETCSYPESRQRALGRRKTVQELEQRIEELEGLLRATSLRTTQETETDPGQVPAPQLQHLDLLGIDPFPPHGDLSFEQLPTTDTGVSGPEPQSGNQLIDLGLFEQFPSFDVVDELTALYFQNIHAGAPMLHQASYTASLRLPPHMRPPMCLEYIVMAWGAATSDTYRHLSEPFYQRARVYADADELKGQGEVFTTLGHAQSWSLISAYECHIYAIFTRASTSLCRGVRIAQMLKLNQLDSQEPQELYQGLAPPRNWIEAEERRRTWWVVFLADRYLTATTGWPSLIDERHIRTNLPSTEESFAIGIAEPAIPFADGLRNLEQDRGSGISPLAARILAANELLHALDYDAQKYADDSSEGTQNGLYWRRLKESDAKLNTLATFLAERLPLSSNPRSLDAILAHVSTNMAAIRLHRTALGLTRHHVLDFEMVSRSRGRLLQAAEGILAVFRAAGDGISTAIRNPLLSFAAYMAASVFLEDHLHAAAAGGLGQAGMMQNRSWQSGSSLDFLANILVFFGKSSLLVRANAYQLALDLKRTGYDASMMDKVMEQFGTLGGSMSEILVPSSKGWPMLFCPALTSMPGPSESLAIGWEGGLDSWGL